jgi:tRNA threonylcarbamoyl adenosine modification protein YeaZ
LTATSGIDGYAENIDAPNAHGERLAPLIDRVLSMKAVDPASLDAIAVGLGPGPFTGLRVGVVTAKTMGHALGVPTYGVCSLDVIAFAHRLARTPFVVVTDARRKQVYWRRYDDTARPVGPPEIDLPVDLADRLRGSIGAVVGPAVDLYPAAFAGFARPSAELAEAPAGYPCASMLAAIVMDRVLARAPSDELTPMYLRRPDAQPPGKPKQVTPA